LLRITVQKGSGPSTLKLEGKLAGPWVEELKNVWRSESAAGAVLVDLFEVSFVDASGKDLLTQMWQGGADFVADSPLMKQVIEEVKSRPEAPIRR
jgi:anti-anti-sigma regulatory factor